MIITSDPCNDTVTVSGLKASEAADLRAVIRVALNTTRGKAVHGTLPGTFMLTLDMPQQFDMAESRGKVLGAIAAWDTMGRRA